MPPLLTQGDTSVTAALAATFPGMAVPVAGALGTPGTQILNPSTFNFNPASGARLRAGVWLDSNQTFGMEGSAFILQHVTNSYSTAYPQFPAGATLGTILAVPFLDASTGTPNAAALSGPTYSGSASIQNDLFLWGVEGNGLFTLVNNNWFSFRGLVGARIWNWLRA